MLRMKREKCAGDSHGGSFTCARVSRSPALYTQSGEVTASHRICIPRSPHSVPAADDEMWWYYHRATPPSSYYFKKTGLALEFDFFLAGSPTWLLKAAWTKTRTDSIYLYNTTYFIIHSRVRLVCSSSTLSLPTSLFHNNHSLFFFFYYFFHKAPVLCFQHFIVSIFVLLLKLFYF